MNLAEALVGARYPGRGILIFRANSGFCALYWISGRSAASKLRTFEIRGEDLVVVNSVGEDNDPLRHYCAARRDGVFDVIGNGDHVDEILNDITQGFTFEATVLNLVPEPDLLSTPRIVMVVNRDRDEVMAGAATLDPSTRKISHVTINFGPLEASKGVLLCTYRGDPEAPATWATPTIIDTAYTLEEEIDAAWSACDPDFRVAMAARSLGGVGTWAVR